MKMRRSNRQVLENAQLHDIMNACFVCRLAMQDAEGLYIVPMNFGYDYQEDKLVLYFHSAKEGRKVAVLSDPKQQIAFEMDCAHKLVEGEKACSYAYSYQSIVGWGRPSEVLDPEEKIHGLKVLMKHQTGKAFSFTETEANAVAVFKLTVKEFTGKKHE